MADKQFHGLVMQLGHNFMFTKLQRVVEGLREGRYRQGLMPEQINPEALGWHCDLGRAVVAGDQTKASRAAELIVARSAQEMLDFARAELSSSHDHSAVPG